jgi:hypothetical protein
LHVKTTPGSDQPDTTLITDDEIPLSNYQHLYTSAFFSNNNPKTTTVVKTNDNTLLLSFINLGNNQQNQPHLAEITPTTLITSNPQHGICTNSIPQHGNCEVLNPSDVTSNCTGQSPTTGFNELSDHNSCNQIIRYIERSILPNDVTQARKLPLTVHLYVLKDSVLYRLPLNRRTGNSQLNESLRVCLVVSESLKY